MFSGFVGSPDLQNWMHFGTMNLLEWQVFASSRSVTAVPFDALARVARWGGWFWSATCTLIGETVLVRPRRCSRWKDLFIFRTLAGHGGADQHKNGYEHSITACIGSHGCRH